jgi:hypothetical protein
MRQWLRLRDGRCPFPGCNNPSLDNEADHLLAWADGGGTGISNLAQPCPKHHRLSNGYWLVWCLLAGWLPVLLDVTRTGSGPSGCDGAFCLTCPSGGAGAGLSSSDGLIEGRPGCHL